MWSNFCCFGKLSKISPRSLFAVWGNVLREFDPERISSNFSEQKHLVESSFFEEVTDRTLPNKISEYLIRVKPQITKYRIKNKISDSIPAELPSIMRILTVNTDSIESATPIEELIISLSSKIFYYWEKVLYQDKHELAEKLY